MRHGHRARLLRVIDEVALREQFGFIADDLDRILVGRHRAVGAEAIEDGGEVGVGCGGTESRVEGQRQAGDIVMDADREAPPGQGFGAGGENRGDHGRGEFLGAQAVAAADYLRHGRETRCVAGGILGQGDQHVLEQGFAIGAGFLAAVEHGQRAHRRWQRQRAGRLVPTGRNRGEP